VHGSMAALDYDSYPSQIMEFTGDNQWHSVIIPYNAATEYLRTYDGPTTTIANDYSQGSLSVICIVPLKVASSVVASSCQVATFVRFHDVEVWEPKGHSWVSLDATTDLVQLVGQGEGPFEGEPTGNTAASGERIQGDVADPEPVAMTQINNLPAAPPCSVRLGRKYEYVIRDLCEFGRRHYQLNPQYLEGWTTSVPVMQEGTYSDSSNAAQWQTVPNFSFHVYPAHPIVKMFGGWSGTLKYRILMKCSPAALTQYSPGACRVYYMPCRLAFNSQTVNPYAGTIPPAAGAGNTTIYPSAAAGIPGAVEGKTTGTWNANTYIFRAAKASSSIACEYTMGTNHNNMYIDVSIPFATNYNMLPTNPAAWGTAYGIDPFNGRLVVEFPMAINSPQFTAEVWQAWGDDFRLHAFSPQTTNFSDGYTKASFGTGTVTAPSGGDQVGMLVFGN